MSGARTFAFRHGNMDVTVTVPKPPTDEAIERTARLLWDILEQKGWQVRGLGSCDTPTTTEVGS
jgi:hypothetical protein